MLIHLESNSTWDVRTVLGERKAHRHIAVAVFASRAVGLSTLGYPEVLSSYPRRRGMELAHLHSMEGL